MIVVLESSVFASVGGVALHPVIVPFALVLLLLGALAFIALFLVPRWADRYAWPTLIVLALGTGSAYIAQLSGQATLTSATPPGVHGTLGRLVPYLATGLFVFGLLWAVLHLRSYRAEQHRSSGSLAAGMTAMLLALGVIGLTGYVGYTGVQAAWPQGFPAASAPATPGPSVSVSPSASASPGLVSHTTAEVAAHATPASCWTVISGQVYDLTGWINQHPGGKDQITALCGKDATAAFTQQHANQTAAAVALDRFRLGPLR